MLPPTALKQRANDPSESLAALDSKLLNSTSAGASAKSGENSELTSGLPLFPLSIQWRLLVAH